MNIKTYKYYCTPYWIIILEIKYLYLTIYFRLSKKTFFCSELLDTISAMISLTLYDMTLFI